MKPGLKKAVSTKSPVSARFRVRNDKFVDFERIVPRGPSSGMVRRVALSESLCKYTEKKMVKN